jgi:hypothetical protein
MKSIGEMTQIELAAFVQTYLRRKGVEVILSGGAAVAFYTKDQYVSVDVDLVNAYFIQRSKLIEMMSQIGFIEEGRYFRHPDSNFIVEFPTGPLAVGEEPVKQIEEFELETGVLRIISPTDCIKDRLISYFHWNDQQCLSQAVLVAKSNEIDFTEVERWAVVEGNHPKFKLFLNQL